MTSATWFLPLILLAQLGADDAVTGDAAEHLFLQIQHAPHAALGQPFPLSFLIYFSDIDTGVCQGSPTDVTGHLILTGKWDLVLEEIDHRKVVKTTSLKPANAGAGSPMTIPRIMAPVSPWQWDAHEVLTHPGNYRFTLRYGSAAASSELIHVDRNLDPPPWITVTVTPARNRVMLGEPLAVTIGFDNHGVDEYHVRTDANFSLGERRSPRLAFTAERDDGVRASDPEPLDTMDPGGAGPEEGNLVPGEHRTMTVPLNAYVRFPGPGTYRVTTYQSMELGTPVPIAEQAYSYWHQGYAFAGTFTLTVDPPAHGMAEALIARALADEERKKDPHITTNDWPLEIFTHLHEPMFLPALIAAMAKASDAQVVVLMNGIGSIGTPDATAALIDCAGDARRAVRVAALQALPARLPEPPHTNYAPPGPITLERERLRAERARQTWSPALRPALMRVVMDGLASPDNPTRAAAALVMGSAAGDGAGDELANACEHLAPSLPIAVANHEAIRGIACAASMLGEAKCPLIAADASSSPGRLICWAHLLGDRPRTPHDEALLLVMVAMPDPLMRYTAVYSMRQDFASRHDLPWVTLFTYEEIPELDACDGALGLSYAANPATIKAALLSIPTKVWDGHHRRDFERRLREVSAPVK